MSTLDLEVFAVITILVILGAFPQTADVAMWIALSLLFLVWWKAYQQQAPGGGNMIQSVANALYNSIKP